MGKGGRGRVEVVSQYDGSPIPPRFKKNTKGVVRFTRVTEEEHSLELRWDFAKNEVVAYTRGPNGQFTRTDFKVPIYLEHKEPANRT
jgi:hypothetical protein